MKKKALIVSIKGSTLTSREKLLLSKEKPWGLILFKRNIKSLVQIKKLIKNIRLTSKDKKFPIMVDEEGSSVSRLRHVINHNVDANYFGSNRSLAQKYTDYVPLGAAQPVLAKVRINNSSGLIALTYDTTSKSNSQYGLRSKNAMNRLTDTLGIAP